MNDNVKATSKTDSFVGTSLALADTTDPITLPPPDPNCCTIPPVDDPPKG